MANEFERRAPIRGLAHDLNVVLRAQQLQQPFPRERFIIDYNGSDFHVSRNGISTRTKTPPPSALEMPNVCPAPYNCASLDRVLPKPMPSCGAPFKMPPPLSRTSRHSLFPRRFAVTST